MSEPGRVELICGPMFSGKTTSLIRRLNDAAAAGLAVAVIKPSRDTRYAVDQLVSHDGAAVSARAMDDVHEFESLVGAARVVGIDEVHFFGVELATACGRIAQRGLRVIAAGVELDHRGEPFDVVARLATSADSVTRLLAVCARCGAAARHSQRLIAGSERIVVGGRGEYEARCDACFRPGP